MGSKITVGMAAVTAAILGGEIRAAAAQGDTSLKDAVQNLEEGGKDAREDWDDYIERSRREHGGKARTRSGESASERALREIEEGDKSPVKEAAPEKVEKKAPVKEAPQPEPGAEAAPETKAVIAKETGNLYWLDESGAPQETEFKKWYTLGLEANVVASGYAMRVDEVSGKVHEKPATFDFETTLFANAWNAVIVDATFISDNKHGNAFRFGPGTVQSFGMRDTEITLELPFVVNTDGLNFGPRAGVEQHFPIKHLPELAAGLFVGIDIPTRNLTKGEGVHVNRFHLDAEVVPHLFELSPLVTIKPLASLSIDNYLQGDAAKEIKGVTSFSIGARLEYGRGAEQNVRNAVERQEDRAAEQAKAKNKPAAEINGKDTRTSGKQPSGKEL